jgi:hypothetical protein
VRRQVCHDLRGWARGFTLTVEVAGAGGVVFDGADLANGLLNSTPINRVTYSCDGQAPVLDFKTADPPVPVTLTPA